VARLLKGGRDDRSPRRRDAVATRFELQANGFEIGH